MTSTSDAPLFTIPVLHLHEASVAAYSIFNPNEWKETSKPIISSCAAQLGLLTYEVSKLPEVLKNSEALCRLRFIDLQKQWANAPWDLENCNYLVEVPEFHLHVQAFLSTIKTFLDLLVQLITTEGITNKKVHGFHKKGKDAGGELLDFLRTRPYDDKKDTASQLEKFIRKQKEIWIDEVAALRDSLIHPKIGLHQITFGMEIKEHDEELELVKIVLPTINGKNFYEYSQKTLQQIQFFSKVFLDILKQANKTS